MSSSLSLSLPAVRHTLLPLRSPHAAPHHLRFQRRWARVHDVRFVATHRDQQQIQDRYRQKLEQKAKEEGLKSVNDLKEVYREKISEFRRAADTLGPKLPDEAGSEPTLSSSSSSSASSSPLQQQPPPPPPPTPTQTQPQAASSGTPGIKPLSTYVDLDKLRALPNREIEYLWRLRFAADPLSLCAAIPLRTYQRIYATARKHPQFILPLPRDSSSSSDSPDSPSSTTAADIHFLQWAFHPPAAVATTTQTQTQTTTSNTHLSTVLFTHLASYKLHGAYAQPHTVVTHHLDLADTHGLVLLHGAVTESRGVSPDDARWLLMCLQRFYDFEGQAGSGAGAGEVAGGERKRRRELLEMFSRGDGRFRVEELVDEAERVG